MTLASALDISGRSSNLSVCYTVDDGFNWVEQSGPHLMVTDLCERQADCTSCAAQPLCTWCLADLSCVLTVNQTACGTEDQVTAAAGEPGGCPVLGAPSPASGASVGGTVVTVTTSRWSPAAAASGLSCRWTFGGQAYDRPLTVESETTAWCESVAQVSNIPAASLSVVGPGGVPYTAFSALFVYYDCGVIGASGGGNPQAGCQACVGAAAPECGWCVSVVDSGCSVERFCQSWLWSSTQCPAVASIDPRSMLFSGGATLTLTGSMFLNDTGLQVRVCVCE